MTSTPWGPSDSAERVAPGVIAYGTPSHGGIHLSATRRAELGRRIGLEAALVPAWYEEDCDWAIPFALLGGIERGAEHVDSTLASWHPDLYAFVYGRQPERSAYRDPAYPETVVHVYGDDAEGYWTRARHRTACRVCAAVRA